MDFSIDDLGRQKFADLLISYATSLASASVAPAGRVIAVDAPWGSGKSWIAKRLPAHLKDDARVGNCIYVDAFQFDYHHDPFAVVTSAILDELREYSAEVSSLKEAAGKVIKASLPVIGKGLLKAGGRAIGVDADQIMEAAIDATSEAGEKAIAQMLESFSQTKASSETFKNKLADLAKANPKNAPLVIVIDELDRCRPSYALEMLERVKHLFDVPNVVFIFFVHTAALQSAVKKTYGQEINAAEYLKKFFSLSLGLPVADKPSYQGRDQSYLFTKFIDSLLGNSCPNVGNEFRSSLAVFAPAFDVSFRDIESVLLLWQVLPSNAWLDPHMLGYGLLLKVKAPKELLALRKNSADAFKGEVHRLRNANIDRSSIAVYMRDVFIFGSDPENYGAVDLRTKKPTEYSLPIELARSGLHQFQQLLAELSLEYVRI